MPSKCWTSDAEGSKQSQQCGFCRKKTLRAPLAPRIRATDSNLNEDLALAFLKKTDLPSEILERLSNSSAARERKVKLAILAHANTPRYVSTSLLPQLATFDLMQAALTPMICSKYQNGGR